jgi:hypothetical protein
MGYMHTMKCYSAFKERNWAKVCLKRQSACPARSMFWVQSPVPKGKKKKKIRKLGFCYKKGIPVNPTT